MPRELANPVSRPVPSTVALERIEIAVSRTSALAIRNMRIQGAVRLFSTEGKALESIALEIDYSELTPEQVSAIEGAIATFESIALAHADQRGMLPNAAAQPPPAPPEPPVPVTRPSALK